MDPVLGSALGWVASRDLIGCKVIRTIVWIDNWAMIADFLNQRQLARRNEVNEVLGKRQSEN